MQIITKESYIGTITKEPEDSFIEITFPHGKEVEFSSHEYKQGYKEHIAGHGDYPKALQTGCRIYE